MKNINEIIPDLVLQLDHLLRDEHSLAGCDHLADTKMLDVSKHREVLSLVVGYSGEASSDVYRVADLVATRLASKHFEHARASSSIAKAMQAQRICRAWEHSFARGFARVILDRVRDNLDPAPGSRHWGSELDADAEFNFFYLPSAGEGHS